MTDRELRQYCHQIGAVSDDTGRNHLMDELSISSQKVQALREFYAQRQAERRFNVATCVIMIVLMSVALWWALISGILALYHWVL